jgi:hypothetical protein
VSDFSVLDLLGFTLYPILLYNVVMLIIFEYNVPVIGLIDTPSNVHYDNKHYYKERKYREKRLGYEGYHRSLI